MSIHEIFQNPIVKKVIFEIRFPNLFYLESKIGDFQQRIIKEFPESNLLFRKQFSFADVGPAVKIEDLLDKINRENNETAPKIWQFFSSDKKVILELTNNSLSASSDFHKTYNQGKENTFRGVIEFVVNNFLELTAIPTIKRIGLRYINICPFPAKKEKDFSNYYNSIFPFKKFKIENTENFNFAAVIKKDKYYLRYIESLQEIQGKNEYTLDLDCYVEEVSSGDYLKNTDDLHEIINNCFDDTIKEPVKVIMRGKGIKNGNK